LKDLNEVLFKVLAGGDKIRKASLGGVKTAAEMINLMGTAIEGTVIESIRSHDADLAQKIMDKMFVFDDVLQARRQGDPDGAQGSVIRRAHRGARRALSPSSRKRFWPTCPPGLRPALKEDLESRGPMRLSEVEAQQKEILKTVRRLADEGQIVIGGGGGDDAMV